MHIRDKIRLRINTKKVNSGEDIGAREIKILSLIKALNLKSNIIKEMLKDFRTKTIMINRDSSPSIAKKQVSIEIGSQSKEARKRNRRR